MAPARGAEARGAAPGVPPPTAPRFFPTKQDNVEVKYFIHIYKKKNVKKS